MQFKPKPLDGVVPIVAAPFTSTGRLDEDSLQQLVQHLIGTGVAGLTLFGLASEFYKLTDAERAAMQSILLAATSRHPHVAGIISITDHSWENAILRAQAAEAEGADALMLLPPFFLGPSEAAILDHIRRVIRAVRIPVIVQYAPGQTGVRIAAELFLQLREELPNLDYVKVETQPPGRYLAELVERSAGRLRALVGYAGVQMPDALQRGACGVQPGCSFAEIYVALDQRYRRGDLYGMLDLHRRLLPAISYWMQGVELIIRAEKRILQRRGLIASDYCRHPCYQLDALEERQIDQFLADFADLLPMATSKGVS
ncbi:MAG TPA: dihydrodipicolinate synthase family protein [Roseiflexaceae bacterium]|nr:dihydrodipicolinate synthase family protein [Roseiflexaceae bacterium]HMP41375.1 dihydrodipicolinate synthase family protein [Roseiflexaceae bacterium]